MAAARATAAVAIALDGGRGNLFLPRHAGQTGNPVTEPVQAG